MSTYSFALVVSFIGFSIYTGTRNISLQSVSVRSSDAKYLAVSSRDGYCTIIEFEDEELGQPHILPGIYPFHSFFPYRYLFSQVRCCCFEHCIHHFGVIMVNFRAVLGFKTALDAVITHKFGSSAYQLFTIVYNQEDLRVLCFFLLISNFYSRHHSNLGPILDKSLGSKEVAKGNMTCEKKPLSVDSMEVDVSASKLKMEVNPVVTGVMVPSLSAGNITLSKPCKK